MKVSNALDGKKIVLTRAVEQARELKSRLENMGAVVLLFPAVNFSEPADTTELDQSIGALNDFDWIVFTSVNAARFFAARCRKLGTDPSHDVRFRCAAVGPATASVVAAEGFPVDHVAQEFIGSALARELSSYLNERKVLLPRSERARPDLPAALRSVGALVTEVVAYNTGGVGIIDPEVMRAMRETEVDVISFFSPSAIENTRAALGEELILRLGARAKMAVVGPTTAAALRAAGLPVSIQAPLATAESMAVAIASYFSTNTESKARVI